MKFKQRYYFLLSFLVIIALITTLCGCSSKQTPQWPAARETKEKVVILGFDGVEPTLYEKWRDEGKLPNIKKLEEQGGYTRLATSIPSQSPVAWSSFATGNNPGKHNVFDFMIRDPKTYMPRIGMATVKEKKFGKPEITSNQRGETFWETLSKNGIRSEIIRVPITFPAKPLLGSLLSGLGVPDVRGTVGTFCYYTTDQKTDYIDNDQAYTLIKIPNKDEVETIIYGPKKKTVDLTLKRTGNKLELTFQGNTISLAKGQWSDFFPIKFNMLGPLVKIHGIGRFYVEEVSPEIKVYLSPICFDPEDPFFEISSPGGFSKELAQQVGTYKTLGWDIDTWALKENRITEDVFLEDMNATLSPQEKILYNQLARKDTSLFVQVFQSTDVVQHMFWRYIDPKHPMHEQGSQYEDTILQVYQRMDRIVGKVMSMVDENTKIIIMSDHGFKSFRKSVDLNSWLVDNGYMTLKDSSKRSDYLNNVYEGGMFWSNVDWSKTKAYGLGLGSIYINLKGREGQGIVEEKDYARLREEIRDKLLKLEDDGTKVLNEVYRREDVIHGPYTADAGDLITGFNDGYRISWQTTFGSIPKETITNNMNKWSGDHCSFDPKNNPGVFITNSKKFDFEGLRIMDIGPTVMDIFGVEKPEGIDGESKYVR